MPMPEGSQLSRNFSPILTSLGQSFIPKLTNLVAGQIFKNVHVGGPVGSYPIWSRADFMRLEAKKLANAEPAPIGGFGVTYAAFSTSNYGIAANWTARDLADGRRGGYAEAQLIAAKTKYVVTQTLLRKEVDMATLIQTAANWTTTQSGVASGATLGTTFLQWDVAASDPVSDVINWGQIIYDLTGLRVNTMVIPRLVWNALRKNLNLIDRIKYGGTMDRPTEITLTQLKALFDIENIYIVEGLYNSAAEGLTAVYTSIWATKTVWLGYVSPGEAGAGEDPSAGYSFTWDGSGGGLPGGAGTGPQSFGATPYQNESGIYIRNYETVRPAAKYVEAELWTTPNVTGADLGFTATAVIA